MNDRDFMRYSRQILLDDIGFDSAKTARQPGADYRLGGLGTPAALYLAGAGVGKRRYWQMTTMCI
ncbi:hypothetical protein ACLB1E_03415 [Escherichia coli]